MNDTDTKIQTNIPNALKWLYAGFTLLTGAALSISSIFSIKSLLLGEPLKSRLNALTAILGGLFGAELLGIGVSDNLAKSTNEKKDKENISLLQKAYVTINAATAWALAVASVGWLSFKGTSGKKPEKLTAKPVAVSAGLLGAEILGGVLWQKAQEKKADSFKNRIEQEKLKTPETLASR